LRSTDQDVARPSGTFRTALAHRAFRPVLAAYAVGVAATGASGVVVAISLYERTGSSAWAGASAVAHVLPFLLLSPISGVVVDRRDPRLMLLIAVIGQVGIGVALAFAAEDAPLIVVAALGFLSSMFWTLAYPATTALAPRTVGAEDLAPANALLTIADTIAWSLGPAVAGLVLGTRGYTVAALVAAAFAAVAVAFGVTARRRPVAELAVDRDSPEPFLDALKTGARAIRGSSAIVVSVALVLVAYFTFGAAEVLLLVAATDQLDMGRGGYGALNAAYGIGAVAALTFVNRAAGTGRTTELLGLGVLLAGLPLALIAVVDSGGPALVLVAVAGLGSVIADVLVLVTMQRNVPPDRLARVFGILESLLLAAVFVGSTLAAWLVAAVGIRAAFVITGAVVPIVAVATLLRVLRRTIPEGVDRATLMPTIELLSRLPMLRRASRTSVEALAAASTSEPLRSGATAIRQGDDPDDFFAIVSGAFDVLVARPDGTTARVASLGPGDGFGEIGLLQGVPRTATVVATADAEVLRVPGTAFLRAVGPGAFSGGVGPASAAVDYFATG
jgi:MFS family permease